MSGQYGPDAAGEGGSEVTGDNVRMGGGLAMGLTSLILIYLLPYHTESKVRWGKTVYLNMCGKAGLKSSVVTMKTFEMLHITSGDLSVI